MRVPPKHLPKLMRSFWNEVDRHFDINEVKEIISLVSFFLGGTPFTTPAVYTLLSYTEFLHDGYHNVKGGMYNIVTGLVAYLEKEGVEFRLVSGKYQDKKGPANSDVITATWLPAVLL